MLVVDPTSRSHNCKVPTLVRDDGSVLTEFAAIATWLGRTNPDAQLLSDNPDGEARMVEMMSYVEGTIHGQGYGRIFKPDLFEPQDMVHQTVGLGQASVKRQGREMVEMGFAILDPVLARHPYAAGNAFTIADAALFYVERWAPQHEIKRPINLQAHLDRMKSRSTTRKVMELWGEA